MKVHTVFGVGTARYIGLSLPHFVDEDDETHSTIIDSPLYEFHSFLHVFLYLHNNVDVVV